MWRDEASASRASRRQEALVAAVRVVDEEGLRALCRGRVAARAGILPVVIDELFSSTAALREQVRRHALDLLCQSMVTSCRAGAPPDRRHRQLHRGYLRFALQRPGLYELAREVIDRRAEVVGRLAREALIGLLAESHRRCGAPEKAATLRARCELRELHEVAAKLRRLTISPRRISLLLRDTGPR